MLRKADELHGVAGGRAGAAAPSSGGTAAHDRVSRASTPILGVDDGLELSVELPSEVDGAIVSLMEGLLNRDHRVSRSGQDAARLLLLLLKAHGSFVYEHCLRLIGLSVELAEALGFEDGLRAELEDGLVFRDCGEAAYYMTKQSDEQRFALEQFLGGVDIAQKAMLHDLGKIQVPSEVLYKPGPLDDDEMEIMRRHPVWGASILAGIPELEHAIPVTLHHHERWDGGGYPYGLSSLEIPMSARIVSVVDAFDAMTSDRPYRPAMPILDACREIAERAGTQFDPQVAARFLDRFRTF